MVLDRINKLPYRIGLASQNLASGTSITHHENTIFAQASAIKIPILWKLEADVTAGKLSLDELLSIDPRNGAGGCGILQNFSQDDASQISLADLAMLMITQSDNVATNLLIDRLTAKGINDHLVKLGCQETCLRRRMMDLAAREAGLENTSTPAEAMQLMAKLSSLSSEKDPTAMKVLKVLERKKESPFAASLPPTAKLANKPGMLNGLRTEWALVSDITDQGVTFQYAAAIMIEDESPPTIQHPDSKIKQAMYEVGSIVHDYWSSIANNQNQQSK